MHILHMLINQLISQKIESKESRFHEGKLFFFFICLDFWILLIILNMYGKKILFLKVIALYFLS